jgi:hypothetical protein
MHVCCSFHHEVPHFGVIHYVDAKTAVHFHIHFLQIHFQLINCTLLESLHELTNEKKGRPMIRKKGM